MVEGLENLYLEIHGPSNEASVNRAIKNGVTVETPTGELIVKVAEMGGYFFVMLENKTWKQVEFVRQYYRTMNLQRLGLALRILNKGEREESRIANRAIEVALKDSGLRLEPGDGEYTYDWRISSTEQENVTYGGIFR